MPNESHDSSFFAAILWSLAGLFVLYVGLFVVLMVDDMLFDAALWTAIPNPLDEKLAEILQVVYWPILWLIGAV